MTNLIYYIICTSAWLLIFEKVNSSFFTGNNVGAGGATKSATKGGTAGNIFSNANSMDTILMTAKILSTADTIQKSIQNENKDQRLKATGTEAREENSITLKGQNSTRDDFTVSGIPYCNIDKEGLCCLMPNYCSKEAICKSDIVGQHTYIDYLNALPRCQCLPGYIGDGRTKGTGCQNVNECLTGEAKCEQLCTDYSPGYACSCNMGYRLNTKDMKSCMDIDECEEGRHNCSHICVNTRGSFICECPKGYILDKNQQDCIDIDECQENSGLGQCEFGCRNLPGGFECLCPAGYRLDKQTQKCIDIDECKEEKSPCKGFGEVCLNKKGGFECKCGSGFKYDENDKVCKDINECLLEIHDCKKDSVCVNEDGGFSCKCLEKGFSFNKEKRICEDINECLNGDSKCDQLCFNTVGSYKCGCYKGFRLNLTGPEENIQEGQSRVCVDIDECLEMPEITRCSHGCINKRGGFQCTCPKGFQLVDGKSCKDIDECRAPENPCENNKQFPCCLNTIGGFLCVEQVTTGDLFRRYGCPNGSGDSTKKGVPKTGDGNNNGGIFKWLRPNIDSERRLKTI